MTQTAEFKTNQKKVLEALVYLASKRPRIDVFHIAKVLFYADRNHLRRYGRPILGDAYYALDDGPIPSVALDIAKRNQKKLSAEFIEIISSKLSTDDSDGYVRLSARSLFDNSSFSRTDIECLDEAIHLYADMPFLDLWRLVHKEPEYKMAYKGSGTSARIPYESFIPADAPEREKIIEQLREHAFATEI